jgi:hypothetical protein
MAATATIAICGTVIPATGPAARTIHIPSSTRDPKARLDRLPTRKTLVMITDRDGWWTGPAEGRARRLADTQGAGS